MTDVENYFEPGLLSFLYNLKFNETLQDECAKDLNGVMDLFALTGPERITIRSIERDGLNAENYIALSAELLPSIQPIVGFIW
ncbi:MAG: hypothetical protein ACI8WB_002261 [Phenylobacterium sp.]|jgi:hypothetical protein